jgi:hypothetical protein
LDAECFECGQPAEHDHHVVPRSRGGTKTVPLCDVCHGKAHHRRKNMSSNRLTQNALQGKITRGERCGRIRFGYDLAGDGRSLVPNPREQDAIAFMRRWREEGKTYREMVAILTEMGIQCKEAESTWQPGTIHRILTRPIA